MKSMFDDASLADAVRKAQQSGQVLSPLEFKRELRQLVREWRVGGSGEEFYREVLMPYWPRLRAYCQQCLGPDGDAELAASDALYNAWRHREKLDLGRSLQSFLFRVAQHVCVDVLRKRVGRGQDPHPLPALGEYIVDDEGVERPIWEHIPDHSDAELRELIELKQSFQECWNALEDFERDELTFVFGGGGDFKSIGRLYKAKTEESARNTGKYHVRKSLEKMQDCLKNKEVELAPSQVLELLNKPA